MWSYHKSTRGVTTNKERANNSLLGDDIASCRKIDFAHIIIIIIIINMIKWSQFTICK